MNSRICLRALAGLVLLAGLLLAGATDPGKAQPRTAGCKPIRTAAQLQAMNKDLTATYCLANDIDAASIANFVPIGNGGNFNGNFYGNGHAIFNLTIHDSIHQFVGFFSGIMARVTIRDVALVNVDVVGRANAQFVGGLYGVAFDLTGHPAVSNVFVSGRVKCTTSNCIVGGIGGPSNADLRNAWSAVAVTGAGSFAGGAVGLLDNGGTMENVLATGNVTGTLANGSYGGLIGSTLGLTTAKRVFASGSVTGTGQASVGGLVGDLGGGNNTFLQYCHATGSATTGVSGSVGGLVGLSEARIDQCYSSGVPSGGADVGGLVGRTAAGSSVQHSYWDTSLSGTTASAAGTGMSTSQLRAGLPSDFDPTWGITAGLSYPFVNDSETQFTPPLASLVRHGTLFVFLPIHQLWDTEYSHPPKHAENAGQAAAFTMVARAIGVTKGIASLRNATIDKYFWKDSTQTTSFTGPVTDHASIGPLSNLSGAIGNSIISPIKRHKLVILRGSYDKPGGGTGTHFMLATMIGLTGKKVTTLIANDSWTGGQIVIDVAKKTVLSPADFPLANFKVNGFQVMTIK